MLCHICVMSHRNDLASLLCHANIAGMSHQQYATPTLCRMTLCNIIVISHQCYVTSLFCDVIILSHQYYVSSLWWHINTTSYHKDVTSILCHIMSHNIFLKAYLVSLLIVADAKRSTVLQRKIFHFQVMARNRLQQVIASNSPGTNLIQEKVCTYRVCRTYHLVTSASHRVT